MSVVALKLPEGSIVKGELNATPDLIELIEDIYWVKLPNGTCIDVGWYPQWNVTGHYCVRVYRDSFDNPLRPDVETRDINEVIQAVESASADHVPPTKDGT